MNDYDNEIPIDDPEQLEQTPINPEVASEMAKKLAEKVDHLAKLITAEFGEKGPTSVLIDDHSFYRVDADGQFNVDCHAEPIGRYGQGHLGFGFFPHESYHSAVGVETEYRLTVGMHTDEKTREQFLEEEKRQGGKPRGQNDTLYFFDKDGNYGKVSIIPHYFKDSRKTLMSGHSAKPVVSEMTAGDFELAGAALQTLINCFTPPAETAEQ